MCHFPKPTNTAICCPRKARASPTRNYGTPFFWGRNKPSELHFQGGVEIKYAGVFRIAFRLITHDGICPYCVPEHENFCLGQILFLPPFALSSISHLPSPIFPCAPGIRGCRVRPAGRICREQGCRRKILCRRFLRKGARGLRE